MLTRLSSPSQRCIAPSDEAPPSGAPLRRAFESPQPDLVGAHWYAVITRSRHEHAVERALAGIETVETYLPLRKVWSRRVDRRVRIDAPALPGYLFLRTELWPDTRAAIKRKPGVVGFVGAEGLPARIPAEQIESLRIVLGAPGEVRAESRFTDGQTVRIRSGPLAGAQGVLVRTNPGKGRLVVRIEHVGLAFSADIHESDAEPVT